MRVLIATDSFPPNCGGSGWSTWELVRGLRDRGIAAMVSGAGPTVLVLDRAERSGELAAAVEDLVGGSDRWTALQPGLDLRGAVAERV